MATCKECSHYLMCRFSELLEPHECKWFADESLVVTLPCRIGDKLWCVMDDVGDPELPEGVYEMDKVSALVWDGEGWGVLVDGSVIPLGSQYAMLTREDAEALFEKMKEERENG